MPNYKGLLNKGVTAPKAPWYKRLKNYFTRKNRIQSVADNNHYGTNISLLEREGPREGPKELFPVPKLRQTILGIEHAGEISKNLGTSQNKIRIYSENFEQTFIKETISTLMESVTASFDNINVSPLNEYKQRLSNSSCSEIEAIYLYDRLISLFITSTITGLLLLQKYTRYGKMNEIIPHMGNHAQLYNAQLYIVPLLTKLLTKLKNKVGINASITGMISAAIAITVSILIGGVSLGIGVVFSLPFILLIPTITVIEHARVGLDKICKSFFILSHSCLKLMFNTDNHIPIQGLKGRLKFWGLSQAAVDYIFSIGTSGGNIEDIPDKKLKLENSTQDGCPICFAPYTEEPDKVTVVLQCGHKSHSECLGLWVEGKPTPTCPTCRTEITTNTLLPTNNKRPSEMNTEEYINFMSNLLQYMYLPKYGANKSNIPFTKEIEDYKYTMYDDVNPNSMFTRANVRRRGRASIETGLAALTPNDFGLPPLPGNPYDGGSRRRRRRHRQKRKTRR